MRKPLFIRPLSEQERQALQTGLRSTDAFVLRRCQILLASTTGLHAQQIADQLHCDDETVRRAIKAFNSYGIASLHPPSSRPQRTRDTFTVASRARLGQIVRQSPRTFGHETSVWTLNLLADVAFAQHLTSHKVSDETIRAALKRLGLAWRRAKHHITSPDPAYPQKNAAATD
jgi:transposase